MPRKELLSIESMDEAREALDHALQSAMTLMYEKAAEEATVGLTISMEMRRGELDRSYIPSIKYKTSVKVPVDVRNIGSVSNVSQLYWDQDELGWAIVSEGEQVRM